MIMSLRQIPPSNAFVTLRLNILDNYGEGMILLFCLEAERKLNWNIVIFMWAACHIAKLMLPWNNDSGWYECASWRPAWSAKGVPTYPTSHSLDRLLCSSARSVGEWTEWARAESKRNCVTCSATPSHPTLTNAVAPFTAAKLRTIPELPHRQSHTDRDLDLERGVRQYRWRYSMHKDSYFHWKTRFEPIRPVADIEGNREFHFWG